MDLASRVHRVDETVGDDDVDHDEADGHDVDGGAFVERAGGRLSEAHDEAERERDEHRHEHVVDDQDDQSVLFQQQHRRVGVGRRELDGDPEVLPRHQGRSAEGEGSYGRWITRVAPPRDGLAL